MGHHTTFQHDLKKSIELSQLLITAFNELSAYKHSNRLLASLKQTKRHDGSEIIIRDIKTNKFCLVDPRPRLSIDHHKNHMIYCRNSKMTEQERINWAKDRVIWLAVINNNIPISYNIVTVKKLMQLGQINFKSPNSNPTALKISIKGYMPVIPWNGGCEGFGLVENKDVVEGFMEAL